MVTSFEAILDVKLYVAVYLQALNRFFIIMVHGFIFSFQVHGSDSDIDALCIGPSFATLEVSLIMIPLLVIVLGTN